jgi:hypothetical protein
MKNILSFLIVLSFCLSARSQLDVSVSGLYSEPLFNFCNDNYSNGWGLKLGSGYTHKGSNNMGFELGFNWLINNNGFKKTNLSLGDYTLYNNWYNWQFKINGIFEFNTFTYYFGLNAGRSKYYTFENLRFLEVQEDNTMLWREILIEENTFQYGFQFGTYFKLSNSLSLDFGFSVLRGKSSIEYINFNSFTFDGKFIDYQENKSSPFLITLSAGLRINLSSIKLESYSTNTYNYGYEENQNNKEIFYDSRRKECDSSAGDNTSKTKKKPNKDNTKEKSKPKLYKVGKTPVNYK